MSAADLAKQRLPSPPSSINGDYQYGLNEIVQHNNGIAQQRPALYGFDEGAYISSDQSTPHDSPASNHWLADQYRRDPYPIPYYGQDNLESSNRYVC